MSPIAMVRDFDVSMSTLCLKLKVSQNSVLRRMLSKSLYISGSLVVRGRCDALNCDVAKVCSTQLVETKLLARVA